MFNKKIKPERSLWNDLKDALFILALCFVTLFTAMLVKETIGTPLDYTIDFKTLSAVILSLGVYLSYLLYHSERQFKKVIISYYGELETTTAESLTELKEAEVH